MGMYQQTKCLQNYTFPIHKYRCAIESSLLAQQLLLSDFKFSALVKLAALPCLQLPDVLAILVCSSSSTEFGVAEPAAGINDPVA